MSEAWNPKPNNPYKRLRTQSPKPWTLNPKLTPRSANAYANACHAEQHMNKYTHTHIHTYIHTWTYVCLYICTHTYIHIYIYAYAHTHLHKAFTHTHTHVDIYTYMIIHVSFYMPAPCSFIPPSSSISVFLSVPQNQKACPSNAQALITRMRLWGIQYVYTIL